MSDMESIVRHRWRYMKWLKKQDRTPKGITLKRFVESQYSLLYMNSRVPSSRITLLLEFYKSNGFGDLMLGYKCMRVIRSYFLPSVEMVVVTSTPGDIQKMIGPYLKQNSIQVVITDDLPQYLDAHTDTDHYLINFALDSQVGLPTLERLHPRTLFVDEYNGWRSKGYHEKNTSSYNQNFPFGNFLVPGFGINCGPMERVAGPRPLASGITVIDENLPVRPRISKDYYFGYISEYHNETETLYKYMMYVMLANRDSMKQINIILLIPNADIDFIQTVLNEGISITKHNSHENSDDSDNSDDESRIIKESKPESILDLDLNFTIRKNFYRTILEDTNNHIKIYIEAQMSHDDVLSYMKGSNEPILVTGDQSMSEAISLGKLFFYELQTWKVDLYENFKEYCRFILPQAKAFHHFMDVTSRVDILSKSDFEQVIRDLVENDKNFDLPSCMNQVSHSVNTNMDLTIDLVSAIKRMIIGNYRLDVQYKKRIRQIIQPTASVRVTIPNRKRKYQNTSTEYRKTKKTKPLDDNPNVDTPINMMNMCIIF